MWGSQRRFTTGAPSCAYTDRRGSDSASPHRRLHLAHREQPPRPLAQPLRRRATAEPPVRPGVVVEPLPRRQLLLQRWAVGLHHRPELHLIGLLRPLHLPVEARSPGPVWPEFHRRAAQHRGAAVVVEPEHGQPRAVTTAVNYYKPRRTSKWSTKWSDLHALARHRAHVALGRPLAPRLRQGAAPAAVEHLRDGRGRARAVVQAR